MEEMRSLLDIFSSIHNIAKVREDADDSLHPQRPACRCGKNYHEHENKDDSDNLADEDYQDTDAIYIENTESGARFALCSACNPRFNCMLCGGTGHMVFIKSHAIETPDGQEEFQSEDITPYACSCMRLQRLVEKLNHAKIPDRYVHADLTAFNFDHLNDDKQNKKLMLNIEKMAALCAKMGEKFKYKKNTTDKYFVTLFGPVGCGKTLMATAALKMLMLNYHMSGKFVDFQYLLSQLRAEYDEHKTGENILNELRKVTIDCCQYLWGIKVVYYSINPLLGSVISGLLQGLEIRSGLTLLQRVLHGCLVDSKHSEHGSHSA